MNRSVSGCGLVLGLLSACTGEEPSNDKGGSDDGGDDTAVVLELEGDDATRALTQHIPDFVKRNLMANHTAIVVD